MFLPRTMRVSTGPWVVAAAFLACGRLRRAPRAARPAAVAAADVTSLHDVPTRPPPRSVSHMGVATTTMVNFAEVRSTGATLLIRSPVLLRSWALSPSAPGMIPLGDPDSGVRVDWSSGGAVANGLVLGSGFAGAMEAYDAATRQRRWRADVFNGFPIPLGARPTVWSLTSVGDLVLIGYRWYSPRAPRPDEVVALGVTDGAVRWRHEFPSSVDHVAMHGSRVFVLLHEARLVAPDAGNPQQRRGHVVAFDAHSGAAVWQHEVEGGDSSDMLYSDRNVLVLVGSRNLRLLDPDSGAVRASVVLPGRSQFSHPPAVSRGVAVVPVLTGSSDQEELRFVVIDLADGHVRWQTPALKGYVSGRNRPPVIDVDAIYACGLDGVLRAHDPSTGEVRWQWGIGRCDNFAPVEDPSTHTLALATWWNDGAVTVFRRGEAEPPAMERAVITGTVYGDSDNSPAVGARVLVAGTVVRTDRDGRFRATVEGRGLVPILNLERSTPLNSAQYVELVGKVGAYDLTFVWYPE